ncbi:Protein required for attachment to host cells [Salinihabitans flavidus]|uniref:Protein required for attachment to host cells n=1 Tax=Salinihabitans flavidus TaxID=569882 RepID=A0A1H8R197_9RHOB|nr:host attachment family protein [Salinihabitans flavidus]SEO60031.1 Protein required for attachment to host cells [Salinihabitans flavidus]
MKPVRTLIVLASESRVRLLENAGVGKGVTERLDKMASEFDDVDTRYADAPGRMQAAPGKAGHGFARPSSEREQMREGFARHVIEVMEAEWAKGDFDRLVIAAPPKMLGELRADLPEQLSKVIHADLDKDLVKLPVIDIPKHLESVLAV